MYIKNRRTNNKFKSFNSFQVHCNLKDKCNAIAYIFIYKTVRAIKMTQ